MISVIIADDHQIIRHGITAILEKNVDIMIIGEAADGLEAVEMVTRLEPDVVIMDIFMPRLNGIQAIEKIAALNLKTKIIALSMYSDKTIVQQAIQNGAKAYLVKRSITEELLLAIENVVKEKTYLSPMIKE